MKKPSILVTEKGGLFVSMTDSVSKQTVKNKIHELIIEEQLKVPEIKRR